MGRFLKDQQFGDNVDVSQDKVDGGEGDTKGNVLVGVTKDGKTELIGVVNQLLKTHDKLTYSLLKEVLSQLLVVTRHLEELNGQTFDISDTK
jgi:hypothetical protein